ncbi:beta-glucosidase [Xylaria sp. FL0043]|nr:beta-glucosidase [Xylaria sp. FL0043]
MVELRPPLFVALVTSLVHGEPLYNDLSYDLKERAEHLLRDQNLALGVKWDLSPDPDLARDTMKGRNSKCYRAYKTYRYGEDSYHVGDFTTHYIKTMQVEDEESYVEAATDSKRLAYGHSSGRINTVSIKGGLNHIFDDLGAPYIRAFRNSNLVANGVMGFTGPVMSGAIALPHLYAQSRVAKSHEDAGLKALHTGLQGQLNPAGSAAFPSLINSASDVDVAHIVDEAMKAVEIKFIIGMFDFPLPSVDALDETLRSDRHLDINWNVFREIIDSMQTYSIVVYSASNASEHNFGGTPRSSLEQRLGATNVKCVAGVEVLGTSRDTSRILDAMSAAKEAGAAVVVVGLDAARKILPPCPSLSPMARASILQILAFLTQAYQPFTGNALTEIIVGDVNPSGKRTMTFPAAQGAFPVAYGYFLSDEQGDFSETGRFDWLWPQLTRYTSLRFVFGLSYTTFKFPHPKKKVVQLHYRPAVTEIVFPVMKLIRFAKIGLAPGESRDVSLADPIRELGYYVDTKWHFENELYSF